MPGWNDIKGDAAPPQDSVPICLRGDLTRQAADLERRIAAAQAAAGDSIVGGAEAQELAEELSELQSVMAAFTYRFTFRALPRKLWRDLVESHPPRDGHPEDRVNGVNMDVFPVLLIAMSCVDISPINTAPDIPADAGPVLSETDAAEMAERLTDGQIMTMFGCAAKLNRAQVDLPKSETASEIMARLAPKSKPPAPGA